MALATSCRPDTYPAYQKAIAAQVEPELVKKGFAAAREALMEVKEKTSKGRAG
jgi:hypothetical protein